MIGEFFANVWQGIIDNKDAIIAFLTSAEVVTLVTMIISYVRSKRGTKDNTAATNTLSKSLKEFSSIKTQLSDCVNSNSSLSEQVIKQEKDLLKLKEQNSILLSKLDTMLEVQSIVYSVSVKDVNTRNTVVNLLTNAKHIETEQIAKLKEKLEDLQNKVVEKAKAVESEITKAVEEADNILDVTKNDIMRC